MARFMEVDITSRIKVDACWRKSPMQYLAKKFGDWSSQLRDDMNDWSEDAGHSKSDHEEAHPQPREVIRRVDVSVAHRSDSHECEVGCGDRARPDWLIAFELHQDRDGDHDVRCEKNSRREDLFEQPLATRLQRCRPLVCLLCGHLIHGAFASLEEKR